MENLKLNIEKNICYIKLDNKNHKVHQTIEIRDDILVDINIKGEIVGIELLNPLEQLGIKYKKSYLYPQNFIDELAIQVRDSK
mgnify:CR=1 FL=1